MAGMAVACSQFSDESMLLPFRLEAGEDAANDACLMADAPYLVALALVEQEGRRALPLTGRSFLPMLLQPSPRPSPMRLPWNCCCASGNAVMRVRCGGPVAWRVCCWWSCRWKRYLKPCPPQGRLVEQR